MKLFEQKLDMADALLLRGDAFTPLGELLVVFGALSAFVERHRGVRVRVEVTLRTDLAHRVVLCRVASRAVASFQVER